MPPTPDPRTLATQFTDALAKRDACTHERVKDVGEEYNGLSGGGDYDIYVCLDCGKRIYVELPD